MNVNGQEMPSGGVVASGEVKITGTGTNHLIIDQSTNKSIINWDSFSVHSAFHKGCRRPSPWPGSHCSLCSVPSTKSSPGSQIHPGCFGQDTFSYKNKSSPPQVASAFSPELLAKENLQH